MRPRHVVKQEGRSPLVSLGRWELRVPLVATHPSQCSDSAGKVNSGRREEARKR